MLDGRIKDVCRFHGLDTVGGLPVSVDFETALSARRRWRMVIAKAELRRKGSQIIVGVAGRSVVVVVVVSQAYTLTTSQKRAWLRDYLE